MREPRHSWSRRRRLVLRHQHGCRGVFLVTMALVAGAHAGGQVAHADSGRIQIGANLAPSWETHNGDRPVLENTYKQGMSAGAGVRYGVRDFLAVETELLYGTRGTGLEDDGESLGGLYFRYLQMPVFVRLGWAIPGLTDADGRRPLTAYLLAGPSVSYLLGAEDVLSDGSRRTISRSVLNSFDVGASAGIGVAWDITPRWATSLEVRYEMGFVDTLPEAANGLETKNRAILLTLGIDYTVNDRDVDRDGVADSRDQCMTQPEDRNGYQDSDGCPDGDDDRDGVMAGLDACPLQAEDRDQWEDDDGCPDADNDEDGFADQDDECPAQPFPRMGGCPPQLERVRVEPDRLVLEPPLVFAWKGHELSVENQRTLDEVAELLTHYYPDMRLRLEGHADVRGAARYNLPLTRRRAEAVMSYLVDVKKIPAERLTVLARGADRPEYSADEEKGMERNRRVDLIVIRQ